MGCLTAPFRLIGCLGLLLALAAGWLYRDRLLREGRRLLAGEPAAESAAGFGRPGRRSLASARAKVDSLNGWRADSVILSPAEVASLVGDGMDGTVRRQLDSMRVRLLHGEIELSARLRTAGLPRELLGPLAAALRQQEPVKAAGPIEVRGPGAGEWVVRSFQVRDFPLPTDAVPELVGRAFGDSSRRTVPVRIPKGIRAIRIRPGAATLYGAARP